jgi:phospholipid/cholesterol/gamma-HCH transport system substrate-binding protein
MTPRLSRSQRFLAPLVKLAIFAAVTILATGMLAATIANRTGGATTTYKAEFTDANGLLTGDDVRIAGVRVGQVGRIRVVRHDTAEVTFTVDAARTLPAGVLAKIRYRNLVGQRYLELAQGPGSGSTLLAPGGVIHTDHTTPSLDLTEVFGGFKPLFAALSPDEVNKLSYEIIQVLQGEGPTVDSLLAHTASLTSTIASRDKIIGDTIDNLNAVLGTVTQRDQQLGTLVGNLQTLVSGLAADRGAIGQSLVGINDLTTATAGLLADARPDIAADIAQLRRLAGNLNANSGTLAQLLQLLPTKLNTITRTATYGSWFNFYLCSFDVNLRVGDITVPYRPGISVDQSRCGR